MENGVYVVGACGFDSIPGESLVYRVGLSYLESMIPNMLICFHCLLVISLAIILGYFRSLSLFFWHIFNFSSVCVFFSETALLDNKNIHGH